MVTKLIVWLKFFCAIVNELLYFCLFLHYIDWFKLQPVTKVCEHHKLLYAANFALLYTDVIT